MAQVFPFEAVRQEIRERIGKRNQKWTLSPTAAHWVEDFYPEAWEKVKACRTRYTPAESQTRENRWKIIAHSSCWKVPWCIPCSQSKGHMRLAAAMDKFSRATPKDARRRVVPWTLGMPYDSGIVEASSKDLGRYAKAVSHFLHEVYKAEQGELGWVMSYQDFGEQAFKKRNPHWHLTMNGYYWRGGQMIPIEAVNLRGSGAEKIKGAWDNALQTYFPGARLGNMRAEQPVVGRGAYYKWLKYEVRELVDLRKVQYQRAGNRLFWVPYKEGVVRAEYTGQEFRSGLEEYRARVKPDKANRVHRDMGYMVGRTIDRLANEIGGQPETHDKATCPCENCDEWMGMPELRPFVMGWLDDAPAWASG